MQNRRRTIIAVVAIVALLAVLLTVYFLTRQTPVEGQKTITVQVKYDNVDKEVRITTTEEYLSGALQQEKLIEGHTTEYGLYIDAVDGRAAKGDAHEFWGIYKNGEMTPNGADLTVIADGEHYELVLGTW